MRSCVFVLQSVYSLGDRRLHFLQHTLVCLPYSIRCGSNCSAQSAGTASIARICCCSKLMLASSASMPDFPHNTQAWSAWLICVKKELDDVCRLLPDEDENAFDWLRTASTTLECAAIYAKRRSLKVLQISARHLCGVLAEEPCGTCLRNSLGF